MKSTPRTISNNIFAVMFFSFSLIVAAQVEANPKWQELGRLDAFHPPVPGLKRSEAYKEWHYFNVVSEQQDVAVSIILILEGDVSDPAKSYAIDTIAYSTPEKSDLLLDIHSTLDASWSDSNPNVEIANSYVKFRGSYYQVHSESAGGKVVFDAIYIPIVEHDGGFNVPVGEQGNMNWFLSSPSMRVLGSLTIDKGTDLEKSYRLVNAKGYHDHNWGYWDWADDMGWDWGQASELPRSRKAARHCADKDVDCSEYSLSFFNYTDSADEVSRSRIVRIWDGDKKIASFEDAQASFTNSEMYAMSCLPDNEFPKTNVMRVANNTGHADIQFQTKTFAPMFLPFSAGFRIIWELTGMFSVNGVLNGKPVQFEVEGVMEYFGQAMPIEQGSDENMRRVMSCIAQAQSRF